MLSVLAVMLLFSSTIVYAETGEYGYHYTLNQTQSLYSDLVIKQYAEDYANVEPMYLNGAFRVTVVNRYNKDKSETKKVDTGFVVTKLNYGGKAVPGDYVKLKIYNYPADNAGRICSIHGVWTP